MEHLSKQDLLEIKVAIQNALALTNDEISIVLASETYDETFALWCEKQDTT